MYKKFKNNELEITFFFELNMAVMACNAFSSSSGIFSFVFILDIIKHSCLLSHQCLWLLLSSMLFLERIGQNGSGEGFLITTMAAHQFDRSNILNFSLGPSNAPGPVHSLPPSPMYPLLPNGPLPGPMTGLCDLNVSSISHTLGLTAGDCTVPLAMYVGNVICCPQFESMIHILGGEHSRISGSLVWNITAATACFEDVMSFLLDNGSNTTITDLCHIQAANLTGGLCPVKTVKAFEQVVDTSTLLAACSSVDPLKECCKAVCQPAITDAAVRLVSVGSSVFQANKSSEISGLEQMMDDCYDVVLAWLARELGPDVSNSAFRILSSCKVNQACPLSFQDVSNVVESCNGSSPEKSVCCKSLYSYISNLQREMLITNVQALECVTIFGSMLKKKGVFVNVYSMCGVDLKDFSLQAYGDQGCLLRSIPTDIVYENVSGLPSISFTCDLNDNILAPWPASSSMSSFPLCAGETLPALPVLATSGVSKSLALYYVKIFLMLLVFYQKVW